MAQPTVKKAPTDAVPNRWVRFLRDWDWNNPTTRIPGRATKSFPKDLEIRLTRHQYQSALAAGVAVSIPNPGRRPG